MFVLQFGGEVLANLFFNYLKMGYEDLLNTGTYAQSVYK